MLSLHVLLLSALPLSWATPPLPPPHITLTVSPSHTYQTISGFGFCEAFQRAHALSNLPEPFQTDVLNLLFNRTTGAGFSILRIGLGSSPDSRGDHMNSPQPRADSPFSWDGIDSGQVWVARQAAARYGVQTFMADAWSAPGYMKTNGRDDQGGWLCGVRGEGQATTNTTCAGVSWVQAYAEYLAKYVKAWRDAGIPIGSVGFLNEPNLIKGYATMQSNGYQAADVAFALTVALQGLGLAAEEVGISCCEGQGWSYARDLLAELQDAGGEGTLSIYTTHTYKGTPPTPDKPLNTTLPVWVTEISPIMDRLGLTQTWYHNHSENEGLLTAINIHEALTTGNVSAYIYWIGVGQSRAEAPFIWTPSLQNRTQGNMWGPYDNQTAIEVPPGTIPYTIGSTYWAPAHFSRFIRPGAKRIGIEATKTSSGNGNGNATAAILASAYRNVGDDGSIVVQIINNGDGQATIFVPTSSLSVSGKASSVCLLETWVTDGNKRFEKVGYVRTLETNRTADLIVGARSLTTLVFVCS